ncbi:MAG: type IX secretion system membrane protein PorP/SprF [Flavobacteriaceae bacterium]|jgi:type IX secretion system PorP/SprF family membrane protein
MKKYLLLIILFPLTLSAQQDAYLSLYQFNMLLSNPAFAGAEEGHVFSLTTRNQWGSLEGSPKTTALSYSTAAGKNVGLGISVLSDEIFIEKQTTITADFSYRLTMANDAALYLGIKAGGNSYSADPTQLRAYESELDPVKRPLSRFNPNLGVGFLYQSSQWWVSGALPRLFNAKRDGDVEVQSRDRIHLYFAGGATFSLADKFSVKPNFMYRNTKGIGAVTDVGVRGAYMNLFELGFSVRTGSIFSAQAVININENLSLGYAYDTYGDNQLSGAGLKAHEIAIRFKLSPGENNREQEASLE